MSEPPPEVVVAGAGPAGLAAALALVTRGVRVELVERSDVVGGKAYGRRPDTGPVEEHGIHGWWPGYQNFDSLLESVGVEPEQVLRPARGAVALTGDDELVPLENPPFELPSPLFGLLHLWRFRRIRLLDLLRSIPFFVHVLAFDHARNYADYDTLSMAELAERSGLPQSLRRHILRPFAIGFDYAPLERLSASSVLSALRFYMLANQAAAVPRWPKGLAQESIFGPLVSAFTSRGGVLRNETGLQRIEVRDGRVSGVLLQDPGAAGAEQVIEVPLADVPEGRFARFGNGILIGRFDGAIRAWSSVCPHRQGVVEWREQGLECPRHGARFTPAGQPTNDVTDAPLSRHDFETDGELLRVRAGTLRAVSCSHVVVATDVPGAVAIAENSPALPPDLRASLGRLRTTPVLVARLWFDAALAAPGREAVVFTDSRIVDVAFSLNAIDAGYDHEGTVIEIHTADADAEWIDAADDVIRQAILADLARLDVNLREEHLRDIRVHRHRASFTLFQPGDDGNRPHPEGAVGVRFAGDWTRADSAIWMMERAVVSGLMAANSVLRAMGKEPVPIRGPAPDGALLELSGFLARRIRGLVRGAITRSRSRPSRSSRR